MPTRSGWDQAPTKAELAGFARKSNEGNVRYAKGIIDPDDDDSHLSDYMHHKSAQVADPGATMSGLQIMKK